jgi:hypothetical protein
LGAKELTDALAAAGLSPSQVEDSVALLSALPYIRLSALACDVEGEEEILERDMVRLKVRVVLSRASHHQKGTKAAEANAPIPGRPIRAFTPLYPHPKDEQWHFILAEPSSNTVYGWTKVPTLAEAEVYNLTHLAQDTFTYEAVPSSDRKPEVKPLPAPLSERGNDALIESASSKPLADATSDVGQLVEIAFFAPPK